MCVCLRERVCVEEKEGERQRRRDSEGEGENAWKLHFCSLKTSRSDSLGLLLAILMGLSLNEQFPNFLTRIC